MKHDANDVLLTHAAGETSQVTRILLFYYVNGRGKYLNRKINTKKITT